ncbi:MAG: hypothetical protein H6828_01720 [Planctomycetes bacterium]|nr:hypothetical protein [Planctomycetota bacterium]
MLAPTAAASDPPLEREWLDVYPGETYWDYGVSLGDYGSKVLADTGWTGSKTRFYSSTQASSVQPVWERSVNLWSLVRAQASADEADVHAVLRQEQPVGSTARTAHLEVFDSHSPTPILSWYFPDLVGGNGVNFCDVSSNGRWVAAAVRAGGDAHVVVFDLAWSHTQPVLDTYPGLFGEIKFLGVSDNGRRVNITSKLQGRVLNVQGGPDYHSEYYFDTLEVGHSFSDDGSAFARPTGAGVKVNRVDASGAYSLAGEFNPYAWDAPQQSYVTALDETGQTLAAAFFTAPDFQVIEVFAWDVLSGAQLLHDTLVGTGTFDNMPSALELSDDGRRLALGAWGDQNGHVPELTIYERSASGGSFQRLAQFDLPGSLGSLDLSGDGRRLACAGRDTHFNAISGNKYVACYDLGADLRVHGTPYAGTSVTVDFWPQTGTTAVLAYSFAAAQTPLPIGNLGTLYLDRSSVSLQAMSPIDATGRATTSLLLPSSMAGQTIYLQGYSGVPRRLSQNWIPLRIQ